MSYCTSGKQSYMTKRHAKVALRRMRSRKPPGEGHTKLAPYRCPECSLFHLGHGLKFFYERGGVTT